MIYEVSHRTQYDYDAAVTASFAEIHQLPGDVDGQVCLRRLITTDPASEYLRERLDYFGNLAAVVCIREPHTRLVVTTTSVIDTAGRPTELGDHGRLPWQTYLAAESTDDDLMVLEFSLDSPVVARSAELANFARASFGSGTTLADGVIGLCHRIHTDFVFDAEATDVDTSLADVLTIRKGVCQDFAHVMIGALRSLGLAACYVSGYLETEPPTGKPRLIGVDRSHAWVNVHVGDGVWIGIDPANDQIAGARYVSTARGRDYRDVPPLKGVIYTDSETSTLTVNVDVAPV